MNKTVNSISGRLSLRAPQRRSLEILARIADILPLEKNQDLASCLQIVQSEFPEVEDFEREFPSLCFALATGVGKTRLMGAFIAYLSQVHHLRHFFVLAPNLTIYEKLKHDFQPNTSKYVLKGIPEFGSNPPEVITGDDYSTGVTLFRNLEEDVHINIFNISKINSEVRGGSTPRIKVLSEYLGQSYFDYLASLEDLVLIMDESHRYRASAGIRAINELKPILGLELTATPQNSGARTPFKNIIYSYTLSEAMRDGFVKEPAVVTKENFQSSNYTSDQLEFEKLKDGITVHEHTKVELETYSRAYNQPLVRPFMLVVAQDTNHADEIQRIIESDLFYSGQYAGKVITVHSNQQGELKDDVLDRLLKIEHTEDDRAPEIVIHVNKLGEGWDVTNLYTIVPLRAFAAQILTEQTIGRGLRLPYGKRVGIESVDTLNIIAHDRFNEIIEAAKNPNSIIHKGLVLGKDIPETPIKTVTVVPIYTPKVGIPNESAGTGELIFSSESEKRVAEITLDVVKNYENLSKSTDLQKADVRDHLVREVKAQYNATLPPQGSFESMEVQPEIDFKKIVGQVTDTFTEKTIDIPRIVVQPTSDVVLRYINFDLNTSGINLQPVSQDLIQQSLVTGSRRNLTGNSVLHVENTFEDYIVRGLIDKSDIDYCAHSELLYSLANQLVTHLQTYLSTEDDVINVLTYHQNTLVELVHSQMHAHLHIDPVSYEVKVSKGFMVLRPLNFDIDATSEPLDYNLHLSTGKDIRNISFSGFTKCCYPVQKFQSAPELYLARLLERELDVLKWLKPAPQQFRIHLANGEYEPDFVVETLTAKYLMEPKRKDLIGTKDVIDKMEAAVRWCQHATDHAATNGGKPWSYYLIPHDSIDEATTLKGILASYRKQ